MTRVIHFVTGGGSGATKVAIDLACGNLRNATYLPLLVLRRKRVALPASMQAQIDAAKLSICWVAESPKRRTLQQLAKIIDDFHPQIFVAHGNSEHIWGRKAAFRAHVPVVIHIEQNCERYPFWRSWSARSLAAQTSSTVCVSRGVAEHVRKLGIAGPRVDIIHNGIDSTRFSVGAPPFAQRSQDIIMVARFARQKDQPTLIRAAKRLVDSGWKGNLLLGGGGKASHRNAAEKLVHQLGLRDRVRFLGHVNDAAPLYHRCRAAILSTHYEGIPLVLIDYMAAGCAAIASVAPGTDDVIEHGVNGWLFPRGDDDALAKTLTEVLSGGPAVETVVARAQADAPANFSLQKMIGRYEALFEELLGNPAAVH
jgi:glycosyltransferase involved in cell wall biosynthesis